jgi:hypothetical protein
METSSLKTRVGWFTAFSGHGQARNSPSSGAIADGGSIPLGRYYIVNRESGGVLGPLKDWYLHRDKWFALYRDDGSIDDVTFIDGVKRGLFRLHPLGPRRMSTGCIVLHYHEEFDRLRAHLLASPFETIKGTGIRTYGVVEVVANAFDTTDRLPQDTRLV